MYGNEPFRKCRIEEPAEQYWIDKVKEEAFKVRDLLHEQSKLREKLNTTFLPIFYCTDEKYKLTPEQLEINSKAKEKFEEDKEALRVKLKDLKNEITKYDLLSAQTEVEEEDEDE